MMVCQRFMMCAVFGLLVMLLVMVLGCGGGASTFAPPPVAILTPDEAKTRLGPLRFRAGFPSDATTAKAYEQLDFQRGVLAFLDMIPVASVAAMRSALFELGCANGAICLFETRMDSRAIVLTSNSESAYALSWIDLRGGPVVVESPSEFIGIVDNLWHEHVAALRAPATDDANRGRFVIVPPNYEGDLPGGFEVHRSSTYGNLLVWRRLPSADATRASLEAIRQSARIHPLAHRDAPPEPKFIDISGRKFNSVHPNDFRFFEQVDAIIQEEWLAGMDPERLGLLASIGIEQGRLFEPDPRMRRILDDAAAVANATARAILFSPRDRNAYLREGSQWRHAISGGSHEFLHDGIRLLDERTMFFYYAAMATPSVAGHDADAEFQYTVAFRDNRSEPLDGGKTYRLRLPPGMPVTDSWSIAVYGNQTRSMLQTDQPYPILKSGDAVQSNPDGSISVFVGPKAVDGKEGNWIQTVSGKGFSVVLRLHGPTEGWFDGTWQPGGIEWLEGVDIIPATDTTFSMTTKIPKSILTPDRVGTRIGPLEFFDGFPTKQTIDLVYDNLDFIRGVEAFLAAIPAASVEAIREGWRDVGVTRNGIVAITESLMDSRSLYLSADTESVYVMARLDLREGPVVVEIPPGMLGVVSDAFFRHVADLGKGGKYLFLPPDWKGEVPDGYFVFRSASYGNVLFLRGFGVDGDSSAAFDAARQGVRIHALDDASKREAVQFIDVSGLAYSTIHANDIDFYSEVARVLQAEPASAFSPEILGLLSAIGVKKGGAFSPDPHMRSVLEESAAVGNAIARAISFRSRDPRSRLFPNSAWSTPFVGGSHEFLRESGARDLDARVMFHYSFNAPFAAASPATTARAVGVGSQYGVAFVDSTGSALEGANHYRLTLPSGIPAKHRWSIALYEMQTRSLLQTSQSFFPSVGPQTAGLEPNDDGSYTIEFGPSRPDSGAGNWIESVPGKSYFVIFRLYGPQQSWFDGSWKPGEIERSR